MQEHALGYLYSTSNSQLFRKSEATWHVKVQATFPSIDVNMFIDDWVETSAQTTLAYINCMLL